MRPSVVVPEEPTVGLYDFLYRDGNRISSYYAQLFDGKLSSITKTDSVSNMVSSGAKLDLKVASADRSIDENQIMSRSVITDPHDVITVDALRMLKDRAHTDIRTAPHGAVALVEGTLVFIDKSMLEIAIVAIANQLRSEMQKPEEERDPAVLMAGTFSIEMFNVIKFPSAFILTTKHGTEIGGTIKDEGMEEPIPTYYFKHGSAGLNGVSLLCIKEVPSQNVRVPDTGLLSGTQTAAQAMSDLLFPPKAIRVTPIALFRALSSGRP